MTTMQIEGVLVTAEMIEGFLAIYVDTAEGDTLGVSSTGDASGFGGLKRPAGLVELPRQ